MPRCLGKPTAPTRNENASSPIREYKTIKELCNRKLTNLESILQCVVALLTADDKQNDKAFKEALSDLRSAMSKK